MYKLSSCVIALAVIFPALLFCDASWHQVFTNSEFVFSCVKCVDSLNCFASAEYSYGVPVILYSGDGGSSWSFSMFDSTGNAYGKTIINQIIYPEVNHCLAICDSGIIFTTSDRGKSWHKQKLQTNLDLISGGMTDSLNGIVISRMELFVTRDGGLSWNKVFYTPVNDLPVDQVSYFKVSMLSANTFIILSQISKSPDRYQIFRTEDSGRNWSNYDYPNNSYSAWTFVDSLYGWSCGNEIIAGDMQGRLKVKLAHTTDGGKTWSVQVNDLRCNPDFSMTDIGFCDRSKGIAVGELGKIIRTSDGGNSWICESVDSINIAYQYVLYTCFASSNSVLVAGSSGRIFKSTEETVLSQGSDNIIIYPNPASQKIVVTYILQQYSTVKITLINELGVEHLISNIGLSHPGEYDFEFNPASYGICSGLYLLKVEIGNNKVTKKVIIY